MDDCDCGCKERVEELEQEVTQLRRSKKKYLELYQFFKNQNQSAYQTFQDKVIDDEIKKQLTTRSLVKLRDVKDNSFERTFIYTTKSNDDLEKFYEEAQESFDIEVDKKMNEVFLCYHGEL